MKDDSLTFKKLIAGSDRHVSRQHFRKLSDQTFSDLLICAQENNSLENVDPVERVSVEGDGVYADMQFEPSVQMALGLAALSSANSGNETPREQLHAVMERTRENVESIPETIGFLNELHQETLTLGVAAVAHKFRELTPLQKRLWEFGCKKKTGPFQLDFADADVGFMVPDYCREAPEGPTRRITCFVDAASTKNARITCIKEVVTVDGAIAREPLSFETILLKRPMDRQGDGWAFIYAAMERQVCLELEVQVVCSLPDVEATYVDLVQIFRSDELEGELRKMCEECVQEASKN